MSDKLPSLIAALLRGKGYPHAVDEVQLVETHASWLILTEKFAYKIKKPVKLPFLDYGSLEKREACCRAELQLNHRLAPDLYLDVVPIGGEPMHPRVGTGPAIEWAVRMKRFAETGRLDHVASRGELRPEQVAQLASLLHGFFRAAPTATPTDRHGEPARILAAARENFVELRELLPAASQAQVERLAVWTEQEFARRTADFAARKRGGFIREGHGDLHLGNLVLIDGQVVPFDCIEFNDDFRWNDPISEIAFVWIDLLDHDEAGLASWLLNAWLEAGGDFGATAVLRFYAVYRAVVRAKIAALRARQEDATAAVGDIAAAQGYLNLAWKIGAPPAPTLTITCGLSGSGKTTLSTTRLLDQARPDVGSLIRLRSDVERKRLFGLAAGQSSGSPPDGSIYTVEATTRTYDRLLQLTRQLLAAGWPVIVDAAFLRRAERDAFRALAGELGVEFSLLHATAPVDQLRERILARRGDASEATVEILEKQLGWFEPPTPDENALTIA